MTRSQAHSAETLKCGSAHDWNLSCFSDCSDACLHSCIAHVHKCCSVGLTMCSQAWCNSSPTHSTFIRLTEGEMVIGEEVVWVCSCMCLSILKENTSLVFVCVLYNPSFQSISLFCSHKKKYSLNLLAGVLFRGLQTNEHTHKYTHSQPNVIKPFKYY